MTPRQWLAGHFARWRVITAQTEFVVNHPIDKMWEFIGDTNRLNLLAGLPPIRITKMADKSAARYKVETRLSGFNMQYDEEPYEWQRPNYFRVTRKVRKGGPTHVIQMSFYLAPGAKKRETRIMLRAMVLPDLWIMGPLLRPLVWLNLRKLRSAIIKVSGEMSMQEAVRKKHPREIKLPGQMLLHATEAQIALATELVASDDQAVASIRPRQFAEDNELETNVALATLVRATKHGYLVLRLELSCPSCLTHVGPLDLMWNEQRCHMCELALDNDPGNLELLFSPSPTIRKADPVLFCPGGPANLPHVYAQTIVVAGGVGSIHVPHVEDKTFRLFARGGERLVICTGKSDGELSNVIGLNIGEFGTFPRPIWVAPGTKITLGNPTAREVHIKLENADAPRMQLTAHEALEIRASDPEMFSGSESVFDQIRALLESYRKVMLANSGAVNQVDD